MTAFKFQVKTDNPGTSNNDQFTLPLKSGESYNFHIDWGDTNEQDITSSSSVTHTYASSGTYEISITENVGSGFPAIYFNNGGDKQKIIDLTQWGTNTWVTFVNAFYGCSNLVISATDEATADTGGVSSFNTAWYGCSSMTSFPLIDTSSGTIFSYCWYGCSSLTSFPAIDTSSGSGFGYTWRECTSLTSFPLIDLSSCTVATFAWYSCTSLVSFPAINMSSCLDFSSAWRECTSLSTVGAVNVSAGTNFTSAWLNCGTISSFAVTTMNSMTNGTNAFQGTTLATADYTNLLESLAANNENTSITFNGGSSKYYGIAIDDRAVLTSDRSWSISDGGRETEAFGTLSVTPESGPIGTIITINNTGSGFWGTMIVKEDDASGQSLSNITVIDYNQITAVIPDEFTGPDIYVENPDSDTGTIIDAFIVDSLVQSDGSTDGGSIDISVSI